MKCTPKLVPADAGPGETLSPDEIGIGNPSASTYFKQERRNLRVAPNRDQKVSPDSRITRAAVERTAKAGGVKHRAGRSQLRSKCCAAEVRSSSQSARELGVRLYTMESALVPATILPRRRLNPMAAQQTVQRTARRTHSFTESVIREMTRVAREHDAINLAQGFPDFPAPELLKEAACDAIRADRNQYAITWGSPRLRKALVTKYRQWYGMDVEGDQEITVTCGATEAMAAIMLAVIDPGDEVIILQPFYENYGPDAVLCGARPIFMPLSASPVPSRHRPVGRSGHEPYPGHRRQHSEQSDRQGFRSIRIGGDRGSLYRARPPRHHR